MCKELYIDIFGFISANLVSAFRVVDESNHYIQFKPFRELFFLMRVNCQFSLFRYFHANIRIEFVRRKMMHTFP